MKTREQKRLEAADRLERRADEIDAGIRWVWSTPADRAESAKKRRDEAARLRALVFKGRLRQ